LLGLLSFEFDVFWFSKSWLEFPTEPGPFPFVVLVMLSFRVSHEAVVGEGLSPPSSLLRVNPSPTSSRSRSLRSSAPKVSSWVCRSEEGLLEALLSDTGVKGSSFRAVGEGKPPEMGGSPPVDSPPRLDSFIF